MHFDTAVDVDAPPETVWRLLTDVERRPGMTGSIDRVELLDRPLALNSRARLHQPRLPAATWTVTGYREHESFTWVSRSPGVTTTATHRMTPARGKVAVRLSVDQTGPLAPLVSLLTARLTRRYVTMEAQGLKAMAEHP